MTVETVADVVHLMFATAASSHLTDISDLMSLIGRIYTNQSALGQDSSPYGSRIEKPDRRPEL
jgi:hypothetical protein